MSDENERSVASAGSVGWRSSVDIRVRLRAWRDNPHFRALGYGSFGTKAADDVAEAADEIARMRLTDAEREDLREWLAECLRQASIATEGCNEELAERWNERAKRAAAMLERLGGGR